MVKLCMVAIFKNEALNIKEWLCYHKMLGVEKFYLYDDHSTDDYQKVVSNLEFEEEIQIFKISSLTNAHIENRQNFAYTHYIKNFRHLSEWTAFCDLDEFVFLREEESLIKFLEPFEKNKNVGGVGIFWRCFGSSGHINRPAGLVLENYLYRAMDSFGPNKHIKCICKSRYLIGYSSPHYFNTEMPIYDEDFNIIISSNGGVMPKTNSCSQIRINHYITKSLQDFENKLQRGRATVDYKRYKDFFLDYDQNNIYDDSALKIVQKIKNKFY